MLPHRLDILATLREDDYIEFGSLGAYGLATMTNFNGYGGNAIMAVDQAFALYTFQPCGLRLAAPGTALTMTMHLSSNLRGILFMVVAAAPLSPTTAS